MAEWVSTGGGVCQMRCHKKLTQAVVFLFFLLFVGLSDARKVHDNWCWCLKDNKMKSGKRLIGRYVPNNSEDEILMTFRLVEATRCTYEGSGVSCNVEAKPEVFGSIDFGAGDARHEKPVQVSYTADDGRMVYVYYEHMKPSFFNALTAGVKARLISENPFLSHSDDLFDKTVRKVWRRMLVFWNFPEKGKALLALPHAPFAIADYVLGFSPPSSVYEFPRRYSGGREECRHEDGFVLGHPLDGVRLRSQVKALQVGQVWLMEESVQYRTMGNNRKYHMSVVYLGGGLFLLLINKEEQFFMNIEDFIRLVNSTGRYAGKYHWKAALVRSSDGFKPFSLKMGGLHPRSVTDFFYKRGGL